MCNVVWQKPHKRSRVQLHAHFTIDDDGINSESFQLAMGDSDEAQLFSIIDFFLGSYNDKVRTVILMNADNNGS